MPKTQFNKYKTFTSNLNVEKHAAKLQEIEERRMAEEELMFFEFEEEAEEECTEFENVESQFSLSEGEPALTIGRIDLSFPETIEEFQDSPQCFPVSYYTLSPKERLLLLYAENFRKQYILSHPRCRPLVLAVPNECRVQKFVCTTIRPTAFAYPELISSIEEIAKFVADFVQYEPMEDILNLVSELCKHDYFPNTMLYGLTFEPDLIPAYVFFPYTYSLYMILWYIREIMGRSSATQLSLFRDSQLVISQISHRFDIDDRSVDLLTLPEKDPTKYVVVVPG